MNILLICAVGMSTSLLVSNMEKFADKGDRIAAKAYSELEREIDHYDVVLVGPQMGYKYAGIEQFCRAHGKASGKLDMIAYGRMDGQTAYNQAKNLFSKD